MGLGRHLRELWESKVGLATSVTLALLAALYSVGTISLFPPAVKARPIEVAVASTRALVDAPTSAVLDLQVNTNNLAGMTNRGVLVGNIMASAPVRSYIGRRAHVAPERLKVASPVTIDFPRPLATSGSMSARDILKSPGEYRLSVQANPTVPILDIYAQAPTEAEAKLLANGAVAGMQDYLRDLGDTQSVVPAQQVHLEQLGRARGGVINAGIGVEMALLSFTLVFGASAATVLWLGRVRRGWRLEGTRRREAAAQV
jgi:hypothetical protein